MALSKNREALALLLAAYLLMLPKGLWNIPKFAKYDMKVSNFYREIVQTSLKKKSDKIPIVREEG